MAPGFSLLAKKYAINDNFCISRGCFKLNASILSQGNEKGNKRMSNFTAMFAFLGTAEKIQFNRFSIFILEKIIVCNFPDEIF